MSLKQNDNYMEAYKEAMEERTIRIQPASYYKEAFNNNLMLVGVEEGMPQWMGDNTDWTNFENSGD
jgi:hypothetical protein